MNKYAEFEKMIKYGHFIKYDFTKYNIKDFSKKDLMRIIYEMQKQNEVLYEVSKELYDKSTPKKPINNNDILECPRCHKELNCDYAICLRAGEQNPLIVRTGSSYEYCPKCGQAIEWR